MTAKQGLIDTVGRGYTNPIQPFKLNLCLMSYTYMQVCSYPPSVKAVYGACALPCRRVIIKYALANCMFLLHLGVTILIPRNIAELLSGGCIL